MVKSISDLPEELLATEILVRLSVRLLLQCKSVCKAWESIVSNPKFVTLHLQRAIMYFKREPTLLNFEHKDPFPHPVGDPTLISRHIDKLHRNRRLQLMIHMLQKDSLKALVGISQDLSSYPIHFDCLTKPHLFDCSTARVVGSYNGIICVASSNFVYLWNPSIRQFKRIFSSGSGRPYIVIGFGYDSISNDYKILKIESGDNPDVVPIVQLYTANFNCWRELTTSITIPKKINQRTSIVVNGVLYLQSYIGLVSFDLHREVFGLVPFPDSIRCSKSEVLDFEGSVAMIFQSESGPGIDLWTLDCVSEEVSWCKKSSIKLLVDSRFSIWLDSYLGRGLFKFKIANNDFDSYILLYDYEKKEITYYEHPEMKMWATLKYTDTLVSLEGFEQLVENRIKSYLVMEETI